MDGIWWDIGPWPVSWVQDGALDKLADSAAQESEREPEPAREQPVEVDEPLSERVTEGQ